MSPAGRSEITGAVASRLIVTCSELVPPALVALHVRVVPVVSEEIVVGPHPVDDEIDESGSLTVHVTDTFDTYHPAFPAVPDTCGVIDGGVESAGPEIVIVNDPD